MPRSSVRLALILLALSCGGAKSPSGTGGAPDETGTGGSTATGGATPTGGSTATGGATGGSAPETGGSGGTAADSGPSEPPDDAAAQPDSRPGSDAGTPPGGKHGAATIVWGYGEHSPTPKPTDPPKGFDLQMKAHLEAKGMKVEMVVDALSTVAAVAGKIDLLVISSSINRTNMFDAGKPRFKDLPIPTIVMKDGTIEVMGLGMGSMGGFSTAVGETQITIIAPGDPLAAGLTGNVTVYTKGDRLIWANPGPMAHKIATVVGHADEITIFAYAAGAPMIGGFAAPAKRMGFFIHRNTSYSADGLKLFDAAVDYLLAP